MLNLSFKSIPPNNNVCCSGFKNYRESTDSFGRSVLVECIDPYEGLSADSFSLTAQLDAGVPLEHLSPLDASGLSSIDRNNSAASDFLKSLSKSSPEE